MTVRFYQKDAKAKESLIVAQVLWQNCQMRYSTKKKVPKTYWLKDTQLLKQTSAYPAYAETNQYLKNMRNDIERLFTRFQNENKGRQPQPGELKEILDTYYERTKQVEEPHRLLVMGFFKDFIDRSVRGVRVNRETGRALSPNTIKTYNTTYAHLEEYSIGLDRALDWSDINIQFHSDYTDYLMNEYDLANNAVGKDFQIIKLVCSEAYYAGINKYDHFKNPHFTVIREESSSIYLSDAEINLLWNLDLRLSPQLEVTRDLFILGCVTGLRYGNYSNISREHIKGDRLHVKQVKTGKPVEIPLLAPLAQQIISKYNSCLPKGAINQVFNRQLRELCSDIPAFQVEIERSYSKGGKRIVELIPKHELIKSHVARRSFASNEVANGTPIAEIMAITGQTTEKSFWKYVKLNKNIYADLYASRLKERHGLKVA